jgi:transposase
MILDLPVRPGLRILVTSRPVDFRRGMDSLSTLVKELLATDPFAGDVFVFRAKRADRLKILLWDGSGLVLLSKRPGARALCLAAGGGWGGDAECGAVDVAVLRPRLVPGGAANGASRTFGAGMMPLYESG